MRTTSLLLSLFLIQVISCDAIGNHIYLLSENYSGGSKALFSNLSNEGERNTGTDDPKTKKEQAFRQFRIDRDSLSLSRTWELLEAGNLSFAGDSTAIAFKLESSSLSQQAECKENGLVQACRYFLHTAASHPEEKIRDLAATYSAKAWGLLKKLRDSD